MQTSKSEGADRSKKAAPAEKEAERLTRVLLTSRDFGLALSAVTFLLQDLDWDEPYDLASWRRFYCYEAALVVSYARPFVQCRGGVRPFSWKDIALSLSAAERSLHDKLLRERNKLFAHSDADYVKVRRVVLRTPLPDGGTFESVLARHDEHVRLTWSEAIAIEGLLGRAMQAVFTKIQELKDKSV